MKVIIKTERLILRTWQKEDLDFFVKMNADPRVMECFPAVKSYEESLKEYQAIISHFEKYGYGFWAVSKKNQTQFM